MSSSAAAVESSAPTLAQQIIQWVGNSSDTPRLVQPLPPNAAGRRILVCSSRFLREHARFLKNTEFASKAKDTDPIFAISAWETWLMNYESKNGEAQTTSALGLSALARTAVDRPDTQTSPSAPATFIKANTLFGSKHIFEYSGDLLVSIGSSRR